MEGLRERVYQVFGSQILDELVDLGLREREIKLPPAYVPPSAAVAAYSEEPEEPAAGPSACAASFRGRSIRG